MPEAVAWLDGRRIEADASGLLSLPFSKHPGRRSLVLSDKSGGFASLGQYEAVAENYALDAPMHIEREQLVAGGEATLGIRVGLQLGELRVDPGLLLEPRLVVSMRLRDGVVAVHEQKGLELSSERLLTHTFRVPEALESLTVELHGAVEMISDAARSRQALSARRTWQVNGMDASEQIHRAHLARVPDPDGLPLWRYELLGKNGEPVAGRRVVFEVFRDGFRHAQAVWLCTDAKGLVDLGKLEGIGSLRAAPENGEAQTWALTTHRRLLPERVHLLEGEELRLPDVPARGPEARRVSLLELRGGVVAADARALVRFENGEVVVRGLSAGDYVLRFGSENRVVGIRVTRGGVRGSCRRPRPPGRVSARLRTEGRSLQCVSQAPLRARGCTWRPAVFWMRAGFLPVSRVLSGSIQPRGARPVSRICSQMAGRSGTNTATSVNGAGW